MEAASTGGRAGPFQRTRSFLLSPLNPSPDELQRFSHLSAWVVPPICADRRGLVGSKWWTASQLGPHGWLGPSFFTFVPTKEGIRMGDRAHGLRACFFRRAKRVMAAKKTSRSFPTEAGQTRPEPDRKAFPRRSG